MGKARGGVNKRKISGSKLANKQQYKLGKQGKLRKLKSKIKKKQKEQLVRKKIQSEAGKPAPDPEEVEHSSADEEQEEQNAEFFAGANTSFAASIKKTATKTKRKRKQKPHGDEEPQTLESQYENKLTNGESTKRLKLGLPLRQNKEVIEQVVSDSEDEEESEKEEEEVKEETGKEEVGALSVADIYVSRRQKLTEYKRRIVALTSSVIENPELNYRKIKELRMMLDENQPDVYVSVRKLAIVSLQELFLDILPAYRIRQQAAPEKGQQLKKEIRALQEFEASMSSNYRYYLQYLEGLLKGQRKAQNKKSVLVLQKLHVDEQQRAAFAALAARALSRLLAEKPNFNYRSNIINVIVPFMGKKDSKISDPICEGICSVFQSDKSGEVTLEIVRTISRYVKAKKFAVPPKVLETFLSLRIKEVAYSDAKDSGEGSTRKMTIKEKMLKMSRRERKREKHMAALERELRETDATVNRKQRLKCHTQTMESVFVTFFRVLKEARSSRLLPTVLKGLAQFGHLINIAFFGDLFSVLNDLTQEGTLTTQESLHCVLTAFTLLSGQGELLTLDPQRFYVRLYNIMLESASDISGADIPILLDCIQKMFGQRKRQVSVTRVNAFLKRCCTLALQTDAAGAVGLLASARALLIGFPACQSLLETEIGGSGLFQPDAPDPEHSAAQCTSLYELMTCMRHYSPLTARMARHVLRGAPSHGEGHLPPEYARSSPRELCDRVLKENLLNKPSTPKKPKRIFPMFGGFYQQPMAELAASALVDVELPPELAKLSRTGVSS